MNKTVLTILAILCSITVHCQDSIHFYGDSVTMTVVFDVIETYDRGYLIAGEICNGADYIGWIQKTSVNGDALWNKSYNSIGNLSGFCDILKKDDGGMICAGSSDKIFPGCSDPMIVKLNACGEKEWCKLYNSQNCNAGAQSIVDAPGGGVMLLVQDWIGAPDVWLFRLDETGGIIWRQVYVTDPMIFSSPVGYTVIRTSDSCYLVTGEAYSPDSVYPGNYLRKIFHVKVDMDGNLIYEYPWGNSNGIISFGRFSIEDNHHNIYTVGDRPSGAGDAPCIFKTTSSGQPDWYYDLKGAVYSSNASSIKWFADSTIVQEAFWRMYSWGTDTLAVIKTDANGNILKEKPIFTDNNKLSTFPGRTCITFNDRVVLSGSKGPGNSTFRAYLVKLRNDLEFDSIYTRPFTYDSLCPHPVVSDTVSLDDCTVITSVYDPDKEPEKSALHIYPNPANGHVAIELPEFLVRKSKTASFTATTVYQQWDSALLEVCDLHGKMVFRQTVGRKTGTVTLDISGWHKGMYLARLVFMDQCVSSGKFLIR